MTKKTLSFLFLALFLISCNTEKTQGLTTEEPEKETTRKKLPSAKGMRVAVSSSIVPPDALTWDTNIYFANFNATQEKKVEKAIEMMKKVISSEKFKERILGHTFSGQKTFVDNGGLSNEQIYEKILDGAEKVGITSKNNTLDVELELYYAPTTTIGYTYPNVTRIWMNTKYFNNYTSVQVAGNLMHEWMHKLGFGHSTTWSTPRDYSVPYAIGYLMEELTRPYQ